jgi:hypothetical protein
MPDAEETHGNSLAADILSTKSSSALSPVDETIALHPKPLSPKRRSTYTRQPVADALTNSTILKRRGKHFESANEDRIQSDSGSAITSRVDGAAQSLERSLHVTVCVGVLSKHQLEAIAQGRAPSPFSCCPRDLHSQWAAHASVQHCLNTTDPGIYLYPVPP